MNQSETIRMFSDWSFLEKTIKITTSFTRKTGAKTRKTGAKTRKRPQIQKSRSITFWENSKSQSWINDEQDYLLKNSEIGLNLQPHAR